MQHLGVEQLLVQVRGSVVRGDRLHEDAGQLAVRVDRQAIRVEHQLRRSQVRLVDVADHQDALPRVDGSRLHAVDVLDVELQSAVVVPRRAHHPEGGVQKLAELVERGLGPVPVPLVERLYRVGLEGGGAVSSVGGHSDLLRDVVP